MLDLMGTSWKSWSERDAIDRLLPRPRGVGNDYTFLKPALAQLNGNWPRLRVSVIVPVYNRRAILEKTLAGLCSQNYPRTLFEVIVADDGSHDRPEEIIPQFRDALDIRIVRQDDKGFRAAAVRNLATTAATGDVIASLDCDMLPMRGWLRALVAPFHIYDGPLCVIGYRRDVDTAPLDVATIRRDSRVVERLPRNREPQLARVWWAPWIDWRLPMFWRSRMLRTHPIPFGAAAGGNLAYWKRDALAAGLHDESFTYWGGEDDEFGYRLYRLGAYFIPMRQAMAYHQAHDVAVPREAHRRDTHRLLATKVPQYRHLGEKGAWETPKISVYIRAGNGDRQIARAIESALAQTIADLDVCVSAPESIDHVLDQLLPYAGHPRVRVRRRVATSVGAASNADGRACKGDLILQMAATDELLPHAAAQLAQALDQDCDLAVAYAGYETHDAHGRVVGGYLPAEYSAHDHLHRDVMRGPRMFRARDLWRCGGWDETLDGAEDYDVTLRVCDRGLAKAVPDVLARRHQAAEVSEPQRLQHGRAMHEAIRHALTRRELPAHVEPFDEDRPDRIAIHFDRNALARGRSRLLPRPLLQSLNNLWNL